MTNFIYIFRVIFSLLLSFPIGLDREKNQKEAGLRTIMLISLGTTVFTLTPFIVADILKSYSIISLRFDFIRPIGYLIAGIGFFAGAGVYKAKGEIEGVTTAGSIWAVCSFSILVGLGQYIFAFAVAVFVWLILKSKRFILRSKNG